MQKVAGNEIVAVLGQLMSGAGADDENACSTPPTWPRSPTRSVEVLRPVPASQNLLADRGQHLPAQHRLDRASGCTPPTCRRLGNQRQH